MNIQELIAKKYFIIIYSIIIITLIFEYNLLNVIRRYFIYTLYFVTTIIYLLLFNN